MKIDPPKVAKPAVDPLGTAAPRHRSEPMALAVKALPVSPTNNQIPAKTVLSPAAPTSSPQQSKLLPTTLRYKPQMETPARSTQNCAAAHFIATH